MALATRPSWPPWKAVITRCWAGSMKAACCCGLRLARTSLPAFGRSTSTAAICSSCLTAGLPGLFIDPSIVGARGSDNGYIAPIYPRARSLHNLGTGNIVGTDFSTDSQCPYEICSLHVLIDQNRVAVRVEKHKASRAAGTFVRLGHKLNAAGFELALQLPHIGGCFKRLRIFIPTRIEGQDVGFEHALEQADDGVAIL